MIVRSRSSLMRCLSGSTTTCRNVGRRLYELALGPLALALVGASDKDSVLEVQKCEERFVRRWVEEWLRRRVVRLYQYVVRETVGEAVSVGPGKRGGPADPRVVRASLASFVASARLVTPDVTLQREAIFRTYAILHTKDPAAQQMNEWYNGNKDASPFARAAKVTVTTDINSVLPISGGTWQVDWQESTRGSAGGPIGQPGHMPAVL